MRTLAVVTGARSDYGLYLPLLHKIKKDRGFRLRLIACGAHLSAKFGMTVNVIQRDGFTISDRVRMLQTSDSPQGIAASIGRGVIGFSRVYARRRPDMLMLLGDRFEMLAAATAALPFKIPIAHIHGGESTLGAMDDAIRHSITKMSHVHFVSTGAYARRVIQMGEEPWRVKVSGAPGLDNLRNLTLLSREQLERRLGLTLRAPILLVTYHPATLEFERTARHVGELLRVLQKSKATVIFTYPNADTSNQLIVRKLRAYVRINRGSKAFVNLGTQVYFSLMKHATAMVGNSSSGIIEAASFKLPVVNIGTRQQGRIHGHNVINVGAFENEISEGIRKALSPRFKNSLRRLTNPYGSGDASDVILRTLKTVRLNDGLLMKPFYTPRRPA